MLSDMLGAGTRQSFIMMIGGITDTTASVVHPVRDAGFAM